MQRIDERAHSPAPPERVFALLVDARSWPEWGRFDSMSVVGEPGVGEERHLVTGRVRNHERVVEVDPPHRFAYVSLSGLPVRDYRADVTLSEAPDGGTDIRWQSCFRGKWPGAGPLVAFTLRRFIRQTADALARAAAAPADPSKH